MTPSRSALAQCRHRNPTRPTTKGVFRFETKGRTPAVAVKNSMFLRMNCWFSVKYKVSSGNMAMEQDPSYQPSGTLGVVMLDDTGAGETRLLLVVTEATEGLLGTLDADRTTSANFRFFFNPKYSSTSITTIGGSNKKSSSESSSITTASLLWSFGSFLIVFRSSITLKKEGSAPGFLSNLCRRRRFLRRRSLRDWRFGSPFSRHGSRAIGAAVVVVSTGGGATVDGRPFVFAAAGAKAAGVSRAIGAVVVVFVPIEGGGAVFSATGALEGGSGDNVCSCFSGGEL
mmetsp:Transcript_18427/g.45670  ORF Transcript_18427/g.45670 Transcript_18427/m.45670 type:complete len:286 (-) Transcript_18427:264-1121(-)